MKLWIFIAIMSAAITGFYLGLEFVGMTCDKRGEVTIGFNLDKVYTCKRSELKT